jgi:WhiB family redox-sensing transcriptional regulator
MATTLTMTAVGSWHDAAACAGLDGELFFPERGTDTTAVRAVCASCPVRWECLEHALANREDHGIWGGLTGPERQRIRDGRVRLRRTA